MPEHPKPLPSVEQLADEISEEITAAMAEPGPGTWTINEEIVREIQRLERKFSSTRDLLREVKERLPPPGQRPRGCSFCGEPPATVGRLVGTEGSR